MQRVSGLVLQKKKIIILIASHIFTEGKNTSSNGSVEDSNCVTVPRKIIWLTKSIHITQLDNINDAPFFLFELNTWVYEVSGIDIYEVETSQLTQDDYNCPDHAVEWPPGGDRKILRRMKEKILTFALMLNLRKMKENIGHWKRQILWNMEKLNRKVSPWQKLPSMQACVPTEIPKDAHSYSFFSSVCLI